MSDYESRVADRQAIIELFARYAFTIDSYEAPAWAACFSEDGIFEVRAGDGGVQFVGRAALLKFAEAHIRLLPGTRHVMSNHLIDFAGSDRARHRCVLSGVLSRPDCAYNFAVGWYDSQVARIDGEWLIAHRTAILDNTDNFESGDLAAHMQPMMAWIADNGTPI